MRPLRVLFGILLLCGPCLQAAAEAVRYELDPVHTRVMFAVSHAGFSSAIGTVSGSTGELWFDPEDWSSARLQASVPIARADLGDAEWNRAALARNLLDAQAHPVATFASTRIEPVDERRAAVYGTLTQHGEAREVKLDVVLNAARRHPLPPFRRTVGFSASTTLSRKAFGIDAWPSVIGDAVELRIEVEATRRRGDGEDRSTPDATPEAEAAPEPRQAPPPQPPTPEPVFEIEPPPGGEVEPPLDSTPEPESTGEPMPPMPQTDTTP